MGNNKLVQTVIDQGLSLMRTGNVSELQYHLWLEYSKSILAIASNNPAFSMNYNSVISVALANNNLEPFEKLSMCLRYLIGIQHII